MLSTRIIALGFAALASSASTAMAHSLYEAEDTLNNLGYYDVRVERPTLPYSFIACKRGARYHIHVDYYGTLSQVDRVGSCGRYGYDRSYYNGDGPYYSRRQRYQRYDFGPDDY